MSSPHAQVDTSVVPPRVTFPRPYNAAVDLLDRHAREGRGDRIAYRDDRGQISYAGLAERANRAGNALRALGARREQRVMLVMLDTIDFPAVFLGAIKAGLVPVPVNTLLTPADYRHMLRDSRASVLVVSDALLPKLAEATADAPELLRVVVASSPLGGDPGAHPRLEDLLASASPELAPADTTPDDIAFWLYSSGSTGAPKGAMHLHEHLMTTAALYAGGVIGVREGDVVFSAAKLFFAYGLGNGLTFPLAAGATAVLMAERPTPASVTRVLREQRPTVFCGVPTLFAQILADAANGHETGSLHLRASISAGEALPRHVGEAWRARFGTDILDGIGSTEMLHIFLSNRHGDVRYGTTGKPVPGYDVKLVGDDGEPVPDGEEGSLWVRGPSACVAYWNQREKSLATFHGPWTRTGDRYVRDGDGYYTYSGRADDMLKVGGIWVSPFEVESALAAHEAVLEAAVVGHADADGLTKPKAFVVLHDRARAGDALVRGLQGFVKGRIAPYKYPRWIEIVDDLPKTATGKIQRYKLRSGAPVDPDPRPQARSALERPASGSGVGDRLRGSGDLSRRSLSRPMLSLLACTSLFLATCGPGGAGPGAADSRMGGPGPAGASPGYPSPTGAPFGAPAAAWVPGKRNTGHPRLWLTPPDLARLRRWATPENPMYAKGLAPALADALRTYDTKFFPNGKENPTWPDPGIESYVGQATESYAEFFAFMSLVDPDPSARAAHGARARNLLMHLMNEAVKGQDPSPRPAPFRGRVFATFNRSNAWSEAFGLAVDWAYPYFSAEDKSTIRKVFLRWADELTEVTSTGTRSPQPRGLMNDPKLLGEGFRWSANNFYAGHMRHLTLMSLSLDEADDPPLDPRKPASELGNTLRSYLTNVTGAWLYQQYAMYEDPAVAAPALGVSPKGLGLASGGLPVEGFLYGASLGFLHEALFALHTAGYDDPAVIGPQARLVQSGLWDRFLTGYLSSLTPNAHVPAPPQAYLGSVYQMAAYGDILRLFISAEHLAPFASMGALDQSMGDTRRLPALRWLASEVIEGGRGRLYKRASSVWGGSNATRAIHYFMLFDPAAPPPVDPRPSLPTTFVDSGIGRILSRTDWTPNATWFDYRCSWLSINHQLGDCNQFELFRKGEWLTKERSGYANDTIGATSDYHNILAIENDKPANLAFFEKETSARGGQWTNGQNAGDPKVAISTAARYVYAAGDATNLYNRPAPFVAQNAAMDVVHASRGVVWIKPDHVVVYDRATSKTAGRFKRWNLVVTAEPVIHDRTAQIDTPGGQRLFVHSLLPKGATVTGLPAEMFNRVADLEPTRFRIVVEDPSRPLDVRFLHVLQGADGGAPASPVSLVRSAGGTPFEGAVVAGTAVMFPVDAGAAFTETRYVVPALTTAHLVTGLAPGAPYTVVFKSAGSGEMSVTVTPGGGLIADSGGVLEVRQ